MARPSPLITACLGVGVLVLGVEVAAIYRSQHRAPVPAAATAPEEPYPAPPTAAEVPPPAPPPALPPPAPPPPAPAPPPAVAAAPVMQAPFAAADAPAVRPQFTSP